MDNRIQIFEHEQFGKIRSFEENGVPWFVGRDLTDNLGYRNGSRDINRHVAPEDRCKKMIFDGNQMKETILVNESGLYSLILSSRLESAKQFKHWVTNEVLPTIRKHGAYMTDELLRRASQSSEIASIVVKELAKERNLSRELSRELADAKMQLTEALPKAAYFDALVACPDCTGVRLTAKELGVSQSMFTSYLVRKKYAYYDESGQMQPYALYYRNGLFVVREYIGRNGHRGTQMLITPKGKQLFLSEMAEIAG